MRHEKIVPELARLIRSRREAGDSLFTLAARCGVTPTTIARVERGDSNVHYATIVCISTQFGLVPVLEDATKEPVNDGAMIGGAA